MKKKEKNALKDALLWVIAGLAAVKLAQEMPAMVRYYKMKRL